MKVNLKHVVLIETVLIIILIAVCLRYYSQYSNINDAKNTEGLLSPRVYAGLLEPKSFLITNFAPLEIDFRHYIQDNKLNVSIYVENLRNGANFGINDHEGSFPASLNKLPVSVLIMQYIEKGKLSSKTMIPVDQASLSDNAFITQTLTTLHLTPCP